MFSVNPTPDNLIDGEQILLKKDHIYNYIK